ncbi:MAG TPA: DUF58 domain-containing protein, partial [Phnomibacter sp.]|nr:DUF58 domain-containing protein [Phnomibacter sp.]
MPASMPPAYNLFFTRRFYWCGGALIPLFVVAWFTGISAEFPKALTASFILLTLGDLFALFSNKRSVACMRTVPERFSNSDHNPVQLDLTGHYPFWVNVRIIEELPEQFEIRNNSFQVKMAPFSKRRLKYTIKPRERGEYHFGFTQLFISTRIGLISRRKASGKAVSVKVYPSFIQMRKYALLAQASQQTEAGNRQLRKIGHSLEFEQIKDYVAGDDIRSINWKATARKGNLMVNHYVDERSQQVYVLLDKGRLMKMPFNELTLLDHA